MKNFASQLYDFFIPIKYKSDEQEFRKARILVNTTLITGCFAVLYVLQTLLFQQSHIFWAMICWAILFFSNAWFLRWGLPRKVCANLFVSITLISALWEIYWTGGTSSAIFPWLSMVAVTAILLNTPQNAWFWFIISILFANAVFIAAGKILMPTEINMKFFSIYLLTSYTGLIAIMFVISMVMENAFISSLKKLDQKNKIIEEEKKRSDDLLLNILPAEVTEELKTTGKTQARNYDLATVLFADFVNFTSITEEMPPEELVSSIDDYFKTIDDTVSRFSIEKIKTVGDAYICASGLPIEKSDNPVVMVQAALDIVSALNDVNKRRSAEGKTVFQMRIGIHSGPLVAGVVGVKKFAYDIWGDTVNTAARMQQNGEAGKINISGTTRELVKHRFNCTYRGRMDAKHKGLIDMYFVEGKK